MSHTTRALRHLGHLISRATLIAVLVPPLLSAQIQIEKLQSREAAAHEILLKLRNGVGIDDLTGILLENDIDAANKIGGSGFMLLRSKTRTVEQLLERMRKDPRVEVAEPNYIIQGPPVHSATIPDDPLLSSLWAIKNTGQVISGSAGVNG